MGTFKDLFSASANLTPLYTHMAETVTYTDTDDATSQSLSARTLERQSIDGYRRRAFRFQTADLTTSTLPERGHTITYDSLTWVIVDVIHLQHTGQYEVETVTGESRT